MWRILLKPVWPKKSVNKSQSHPVEGFEFGQNESAVLLYEHVVEPDFAATVFLCQNQDEVPVDGGCVAVPSVLIGVTRREVDGTGNLLGEEDVAHRLCHLVVETVA